MSDCKTGCMLSFCEVHFFKMLWRPTQPRQPPPISPPGRLGQRPARDGILDVESDTGSSPASLAHSGHSCGQGRYSSPWVTDGTKPGRREPLFLRNYPGPGGFSVLITPLKWWLTSGVSQMEFVPPRLTTC